MRRQNVEVIQQLKGVNMKTALLVIQLIIAIGIVDVWIFRFGRSTPWRGGSAANMREEFRVYGLPAWSVGVIGLLKLACAACLVAGIWVPELIRPAAVVLAALMLGAVVMHFKVKDPIQKSLPASTMLAMSLIVAIG